MSNVIDVILFKALVVNVTNSRTKTKAVHKNKTLIIDFLLPKPTLG